MKRIASLLLAVYIAACGVSPSVAAAVTVKVGYFSLAKVKQEYTVSKDADAFRTQAEATLRKEVADGNQSLVDAQNRHVSKAEIEQMARDLQQRINAHQSDLIKQTQDRRKQADDLIGAAAAEVARQNGLDVMLDGEGVFGGGDKLVTAGADCTDAILHSLGVSGHSAQVSRNAAPVALNFGYFNRAEAKKQNPQWDVETLRTTSEATLARDVSEGNKRLEDAHRRGVSRAQVEQMARDLQRDINAKQAALIALVRDKESEANRDLGQSLQRVRGNCDTLVDGASVWYGSGQIAHNGVDLTNALLGRSAAPSTVASSSSDYSPPPPVASSDSYAPPPTAPSPTQSQPSSATSGVDAPIKDKWAVIVGISNFQNPKYNLHYSAKDAMDFRQFLIKEQNFREDHIVTLIDQQATRANIMSAFGSRWLPNVAEPGDLVVIYISTHGTPSSVDNGGRNYVVAYDTDANDLYATAVDMDELSRRIKEGVKTDRALIVLDTCFSGGSIPGSRSLNRVANFDLTNFPVGKGHLIISSSSPNQASWESKQFQNGIFTHYLIEALRSNRGDVQGAFPLLQEKVQWEVKRDYGFEQQPQLGGNWQGSQLVLSAPASKPRPMTNPRGEHALLNLATQPKSAPKAVPATKH